MITFRNLKGLIFKWQYLKIKIQKNFVSLKLGVKTFDL